MKVTKLHSGLTLLLLVAAFPAQSFSQVSVRSLSSGRYGEAFGAGSDAIPSYYSDIVVEYRRGNLLVGVRGEGFKAPDLDGRDYQRINQRYAEYSWDWGLVRAGHFYSIFGKGTILRGFELPGFIYEDQVFQARYSVTRDFDGAKVVLSPGGLRLTLMRGTAVTNPLFPPDLEDDDDGTLTGGQVELDVINGVSAGTGYLEYDTSNPDLGLMQIEKLSTYFASVNLDRLVAASGLPNPSLSLYTEYATDRGYAKSMSLIDEASHALYISSTFAAGDFGGSVELKDYKNFAFGINDPPPLVRESSEYLLNRLTHELDASKEDGFQAEVFYAVFDLSRLIANYSRSRFGSRNLVFEERYLAFERAGYPWTWRAFIDHGKDGRDSEASRFTAGLGPDFSTATGATISFDLQWQRIRREFATPGFDHTLTNWYTAIRLQGWRDFSFGLNSERTTDPFEGEDPRWFINANIGWQPVPQLSLQLFAGNRRQGTLCDYGFCIPVLEFKGVELRMETFF